MHCQLIVLFKIVCAKDTYPKGLKWNCRKSYSCTSLARSNMCKKKNIQVMSRGCSNQISQWNRNQVVRIYCKKSCANCISMFSF